VQRITRSIARRRRSRFDASPFGQKTAFASGSYMSNPLGLLYAVHCDGDTAIAPLRRAVE
ncbi:MAG TPA: hypothetical protein VIN75_24400, partial [Burkholderiaceae bacterium]